MKALVLLGRLLLIGAFVLLFAGALVAANYPETMPVPCGCPTAPTPDNGTSVPCLCPTGTESSPGPVGLAMMLLSGALLVAGIVLGRVRPR